MQKSPQSTAAACRVISTGRQRCTGEHGAAAQRQRSIRTAPLRPWLTWVDLQIQQLAVLTIQNVAPLLLRRLAVPLGTAPVVGMGLMLNGGYGILSRKYGPTCDSILEVQLVNAEGEVVSFRGRCGSRCHRSTWSAKREPVLEVGQGMRDVWLERCPATHQGPQHCLCASDPPLPPAQH